MSRVRTGIDRGVLGRFTFTCYKGDELADAFLHAFFSFFGDFGVFRECCLHNSSNWSKISYVSIRCKAVVPRTTLG